VALVLMAGSVAAQDASNDLQAIKAQLAAQARRLDEQQQEIAAQGRLIEAQRREIEGLKSGQVAAPTPQAAVAAQAPPPGAPSNPPVQTAQAAPTPTAPSGSPTAAPLPPRPVGEPPPPPTATVKQVANTFLPQGIGVLARKGQFILEPSVEYDRISTNRLVFQGVAIVPGIQLGVVNASTVDADAAIGTVDLRYGVTNRLELELRVPYVYNNDLTSSLAQQVAIGTPPATQTEFLQGHDIGDVEFDAHYQFNRGAIGEPIFVGNLRVKTVTGRGPFDVDFNSSGISTDLPTGTGFWDIEPALTVLLPLDPIVLYANAGYLYGVPENVNKMIGTTLVGQVNPGSAADLSWGFGFALNPRFSASFGFTDQYYYRISEVLGGTFQKSRNLEVGAFTFGWSYRINRRLMLINNFEFGVTPDAPNVRVVFRLPLWF
jgi:hypothetical protein